MIENAKNKVISDDDALKQIADMSEAEKPRVVKPVPMPSVDTQLYHFSGSGKYFPIAIQASSQEQAIKIWETKRVPYQK